VNVWGDVIGAGVVEKACSSDLSHPDTVGKYQHIEGDTVETKKEGKQ